jgi:hypothetical protein
MQKADLGSLAVTLCHLPAYTVIGDMQVAEPEYMHSCRAVRTFSKMSLNLYKFYHFFALLCSDKISLE